MRCILLILLLLSVATPSLAAQESSLYRGFKYILFDTPPAEILLNNQRIDATDVKTILRQPTINSVTIEPSETTGCITVNPYDHEPLMARVGETARVLANNSGKNVEGISIQPQFSGLMGPKLTLIRNDLENTIIHHRGSPQEIFHNARVESGKGNPCGRKIASHIDIEMRNHIDAFESKEAPLMRSDAIVTGRVEFGGHFMVRMGMRLPIYDNLSKEIGLQSIDRLDPIRQDVLAYVWQGQNVERMMMSGFATPFNDTYVAAHAGYLEENFAGVGGEFLYRPRASHWAIGGELWHTAKRTSYNGSLLSVDSDNRQTSALLNSWYDIPYRPISLGLSAGRFMDGDLGTQGIVLYRPAAGWTIKGYATWSNEAERDVNNNKTNMTAGLNLTMPLTPLRAFPVSSRMTATLAPFARDKGQRLNNNYALYDLTDPWSVNNLHRYWDRVSE